MRTYVEALGSVGLRLPEKRRCSGSTAAWHGNGPASQAGPFHDIDRTPWKGAQPWLVMTEA
jgi:hypothetical protein